MAGAIAAGTGVLETLIKECDEEASIGTELANCAKPIGTIRYLTMYIRADAKLANCAKPIGTTKYLTILYHAA